MLTITNLSCGYARTSPILTGLSVCLPSTGLYLLEAPNGTGKSTLFEVLSGYLPPISGTVQWNGTVLTPRTCLGTVQLLRTQPELVPHLTLRDNIGFAAKSWGADPTRAAALSRDLHLGPHLDTIPSEASTGTAKKAWLAMGLLSHSPVVCLDEPLNGLDRDSAQFILGTLHRLAQDRLIIMACHLLADGIFTRGQTLTTATPLTFTELALDPH